MNNNGRREDNKLITRKFNQGYQVNLNKVISMLVLRVLKVESYSSKGLVV
jgi:hypothetical protein